MAPQTITERPDLEAMREDIERHRELIARSRHERAIAEADLRASQELLRRHRRRSWLDFLRPLSSRRG